MVFQGYCYDVDFSDPVGYSVPMAITIDTPAKDIEVGDIVHAWGFQYEVTRVEAFKNGRVHIYVLTGNRETLTVIHGEYMVRRAPRG